MPSSSSKTPAGAASRGATDNIYLLIGPDRYRKRERIEAIARELAVNLLDRHEVSGRELSAISLGDLLRGQAAASQRRLVIIDEAHRLDAACLKLLAEQGTTGTPTACIVLLFEELEGPAVLAALGKQATIEPCAALAPHEVGQWIRRYVATHQKRATPSAIQDLVQILGADLGGIRLLLDQLMTWMGPRQDLSAEDVRVFLPVPSTSGNFALANALGRRDLPAALEALGEELARGREPIELIGMLAWQLQRWLAIARGLEAGLGREQIAMQVGLRAGHLNRLIAELQGRSVESLRLALEECWELDCAAKSGRAPMLRVELERLLVQVCLAGASDSAAGKALKRTPA